jgi:hypothetical protein
VVLLNSASAMCGGRECRFWDKKSMAEVDGDGSYEAGKPRYRRLCDAGTSLSAMPISTPDRNTDRNRVERKSKQSRDAQKPELG